MKNKFRELIIRLCSKLLPGLKDHAVILMYHSIGGSDKFFNVRQSDFEIQMRFLHSQDYQVVPLPELCARLKRREDVGNMVALTFDDGYKDFLDNALPILERYRFPATVFVITGKMGGDKMTREDLLNLSKNPLVALMPHTHNHPDLDGLSLSDSLSEINKSRLEVENITSRSADILAYPRGKYTEKIKNELRNSGDWLAAVTVEPGSLKLGDDLFELKRIPIDSGVSKELFPALLTRGIDLYESLKIWR